MDQSEINQKLEEIGKPYNMTPKDLQPEFEVCKRENENATDIQLLGLVRKRLQTAFGFPETAPEETPATTEKQQETAPLAKAPSTAEPEVTELLEGKAGERATIVSAETHKASEIFKDKAKDPERDMLKLIADNDSTLTMSFPKGMAYENNKWRIINKIKAVRSTRNKLSKFGAFLRKYGKYPEIGVEVETDLDEDGFARIVV